MGTTEAGESVRQGRSPPPDHGADDDLPAHSKEVAKGSFWSIAGNVFFKLTSFLYAIMLARMASQDDLGLFNLSLSILTVIMVFSDLGIPGSLQRFIPYYEGKGEKGKIKALFHSAYIIVLLVSMLVMAALWLAADAIGAQYRNALLPGAIRMLVAYVLIGNVFKLHYIYLQGRADIKSMQLVQNTQNILKLFLTAGAFYLYGASVLAISVSFVLSHVIALAISMPYISRRSSDLPPSGRLLTPVRELLGEILPFGIMISVVNSFSLAIVAADDILLGYLVPPAEALRTVAIYSYATTLAVVLTTLPLGIEAIFMPVISRLVGKGSMDDIRSAAATAQRWTLLLTIPLAIVMMVFSGDILSVLYGEAYRPGALSMSLVTFAYLMRSYASVLILTLAAMRLVRLEMKIYAVTAALNVGLNILLIPSFGMAGSAAAIVLSFGLLFALFYSYSRKEFGFTMPPEVARITAAGAVSLIFVFLLGSTLSSLSGSLPQVGSGDVAAYSAKVIYLGFLIALMCFSTALFGAFCLILKCLRKEDVALLRRVLSRAGVPAFLARPALGMASWGVGPGK
jgi:O-antigen/teichoic acid export membrane protein